MAQQTTKKPRLTGVERLQIEIDNMIRFPYVIIDVSVVNLSKYKYLARNHYGETVATSNTLDGMRYNLVLFFSLIPNFENFSKIE